VRPGAAEELRRVIPVVEALAADGALVSVDTMRADVAARAQDAGAVLV
jgi:dihydropteroate synthase